MVFTSQVHSKPAIGLFRLKPAGQAAAKNSAGPPLLATGIRRNSPLLPPDEGLLLHEDHILQGYPDQQGGGGDIGDGGGHDQPVGRAAVARGLR